MSRRSVKTAIVFSILVFIIMVVSISLTFFIAMCAFWLGWFEVGPNNPETLMFAFAVVCVIVGTVLSQIIGKRPIGVIVGISDATKEIAKGNFKVKLNENIPAKEIRVMAQNFNIMTRELAATEILRNDFIENVSHEFKTPLAAIEGYATLLQKKGLSEEKQAEYTKRILYNVKRLSELTGNILLLSRLENQKIGISKEMYCLDEQIRETILLFEEQWNTKKLELEIELDNTNYYGNKELMAQVWQNLIGNAIKFVPDGGRIRILLHKGTDSLKVVVSDCGIGMSQETISRMYEKFYQGDKSHATDGNGLGLTLVKRIVDLHNGEIEVSSMEGKGTTFTISLPVDENQSPIRQ